MKAGSYEYWDPETITPQVIIKLINQMVHNYSASHTTDEACLNEKLTTTKSVERAGFCNDQTKVNKNIGHVPHSLKAVIFVSTILYSSLYFGQKLVTHTLLDRKTNNPNF